ncbi:double zinc ribbon domain-containing protein [Paludisphaera mucosa]|uniref:Zinc ribbon domain-containing protein n=1 Tax=Paludisphaera mucosa TaxID=3030827 RepID=A0ABT6FK74_9BACT|nr:zinc ribbon domain-containing protein [Paludisphaera mucosa]MDG3007901.1 zinc ribbon domain-containing protein [Paludisphaera mucosa]
MWDCPKCRSKVDDSFEVCWSCGTTVDGVEDPDFVTADEADPTPDEPLPEEETLAEEVDGEGPFAELAGEPLPEPGEWDCPKCGSKVDDSFEVCWACGTTADGVEDPGFVTADEAEPILDEVLPEVVDVDDPFAELAGEPLPELAECFMASNPIEAKFVADQLMEEGIPAIADRIDVNMVMGGFKPQMWGYGPKVRVRKEDLPRAQRWLKGYEERRRRRQVLD